MKYLVLCPCGHDLDRHSSEGCGGDGRLACYCGKDQEGALEAAIDRARTHPWGVARTLPEAEQGAA